MDVPYCDLLISEDNLLSDSKLVVSRIKPGWNIPDIKCKIFTDGLTNKLIACIRTTPTTHDNFHNNNNNNNNNNHNNNHHDNNHSNNNEDDNNKCDSSPVINSNDVVLVRIYGKGTDLLINRDQEKLSMVALQSIGCAQPLYGCFRNGILYGYAPGVVFDKQHLFDFNVQSLVMEEMIKMHSLDDEKLCAVSGGTREDRKCQLFSTMERWMSNIPDEDTNMPSGWVKGRLSDEIKLMESHLSKLSSPIVFCHNDLLPKNIIYDELLQKVSFIDFEYTFFNYQAFDIGNYFCEFAGMKQVDYTLYPSKEFQMKWLQMFLQRYNKFHGVNQHVTQHDVNVLYAQVNQCALASHLFWAVWAIIQASHSTLDFDYIDFAQKRLAEYETRRDQYLNLSNLFTKQT